MAQGNQKNVFLAPRKKLLGNKQKNISALSWLVAGDKRKISSCQLAPENVTSDQNKNIRSQLATKEKFSCRALIITCIKQPSLGIVVLRQMILYYRWSFIYKPVLESTLWDHLPDQFT